MDTLGRLLHLLALLQQRPTWTAEELAERLSITPRTVRRDVTRLRDLGYTVDAEAGRHGGYRLAGGQAVPPLTLTDDEAVAVALALRHAAGSGVAGVEESAVTALAKLEQVLPARLREQVHSLATATDHLPGGEETTIDSELLVTLAHVCRRRERIRCGYVDHAGRSSRRDLEPYRLVQARRRWYLAAFDRGRDDWRTFRVDRIHSAEPQGVPIEPREAPDALELVASSITLGPYRWHATVRLDVPIELARRVVSPTAGVVSTDGEQALLRIGANDLDWLARYLVGLEIPFEVDEPPELRAALAALGRRLATHFDDGPT